MSVDEPVAVAKIADICAALRIPSEPRQHAQLATYLQLLHRWNHSYNITAVRDADMMLRQHLADCLSVVPSIGRSLSHVAAPRILDVGSGGGLPGLVLAVMLPEAHVTCVDKVGKKAAFVRQVSGLLGLTNFAALHARAEQLTKPVDDVITARAFGSLSDLIQATAHCLKPTGVWAAMKGKVPSDEIAAVSSRVAVFHVEPILVPQLDAERCLIWMRPTSAGDLQGAGRDR